MVSRSHLRSWYFDIWCSNQKPVAPAMQPRDLLVYNSGSGTPNNSPFGMTTKGGGHIWIEGQETHAPYVNHLRLLRSARFMFGRYFIRSLWRAFSFTCRYQLGSGWPSVNGGPTDQCYDRWGNVHVPSAGLETVAQSLKI